MGDWAGEASHFTPWLAKAENLELLSETLGIELELEAEEKDVGPFRADILCKESLTGSWVLVENQLERSDHDHLGKLITYMVALDARAAIWVVAEPRPEHVSAITWLNEASSADFYLVKLEAIRIGRSDPAPLLTMIVGPSEEAREVGRTKQELAERHFIRHEFWSSLLGRAKAKTSLHANISPSRSNWIGAGAGKQGLGFNYVTRQHGGQVELYIDRGQDSEKENKAIFDSLVDQKSKIEEAFGESLDWQRLEGPRASRIRKELTSGGYRDDERWPQIQDEMIDNMIRLSDALKPHILQLEI